MPDFFAYVVYFIKVVIGVQQGAGLLIRIAAFVVRIAALTIASRALMSTPKGAEGIVGRMQMSRDPVPPRRLAYGSLRLSGPMLHAEASPAIALDSFGVLAPEKGGKNKFLTFVVALAGHEVRDIRDIRLNNEVLDLVVDGYDTNGYPQYIPDTGNRYAGYVRIKKYYGVSDQPADVDFIYDTQFNIDGKWLSTDRARGIAYVVCRIKYDPNVFSAGWPNLTAMVDGKLIGDPSFPDADITGEDTGTDVFAAPLHGLTEGHVVTFRNEGGALPGGLTADTEYYVTVLDDNTFKVAASRLALEKSEWVDIASNGTGQNYVVSVRYFSRNPCRQLADFLTTPYTLGGLGEEWARVDTAILLANANICDEQITRGPTPPDTRYYCDCVGDAGENPADIIGRFLMAMAGSLNVVNGKYWIRAGYYREPDMTIDDDELVGDIELLPNGSSSNAANAFRGVYSGDENDGYPLRMPEATARTPQLLTGVDHTTETFTVASPNIFEDGDAVSIYSTDAGDLPAGLFFGLWYYVVNRTDTTFQISTTPGGSLLGFTSNGSGTLYFDRDPYLTQDGQRIYGEMEFDSVTDPYLCQHLATIMLRQLRNDMRVQLTTRMIFFDKVVGDTIRVLNGAFGLWEETEDTATLTFTEDSTVVTSAGHGLSVNDAVILSSTGNLPEPFIAGRLYRIKSTTTDTFKLAYNRSTPERDYVVATGEGTGTHTWLRVIGKVFEVEETALMLEEEPAAFAVRMSLRETFPEFYDYNYNFVPPYDQSPNTELPDPRDVDAPENLDVETGTNALYVQADGRIVSRAHLTWDLVDDYFVVNGGTIQVEYKKSADSVWLFGAYLFGNSTEHYITDVEDGVEYDFRIRASNFSAGVRSAWTTVSGVEIVGKTAAPGGISSFGVGSAASGIILTWSDPTDVDFSHVEIYRSHFPSGIGPFLPYEFLTTVAKGAEYYFDTKPVDRAVNYWTRTVDTSGNVGTLDDQSVSAYPLVPAMHTNVTGKQLSFEFTADTTADEIDIEMFAPLDGKECFFVNPNGNAYLAGTNPRTLYYLDQVSGNQFKIYSDSGLTQQVEFPDTDVSGKFLFVVVDALHIRQITDATSNIITLSNSIIDEIEVKFSTTGTLPAPLSAANTYTIKYMGADTEYQVWFGGSQIDLTTGGTGTHTVTAGQYVLCYQPSTSPLVAKTVLRYADAPAGSGPPDWWMDYDYTADVPPQDKSFVRHFLAVSGFFPTSISTKFVYVDLVNIYGSSDTYQLF